MPPPEAALRAGPQPAPRPDRSSLGGQLLPPALALALCLIGIGWGLPNRISWANDDIAPDIPLRAVQTFRSGWDKYPNLQPLIDRALYAPALARWRAEGSLEAGCDPADPACHRDPDRQLGLLMLISRLRSALAVAITVALVRMLALALFADAGVALAAGLLAAMSASLVFFGQLGNLDAPLAAWFALSMLAYTKIGRPWIRPGVEESESPDVQPAAPDWKPYALLGLAVGAALSTKEAIAGAYLLPGPAILALEGGRARRSRGRRYGASIRSGLSWIVDSAKAALSPRILGPLLLATGLYGLQANVIFNPEGFRQHIAHWISGGGIGAFNNAYRGPLWLAGQSLERLLHALGAPLMLAGLAGLGLGLRWHPRATVWMLAPLCSYYLFTIQTAGFVYERFMLPIGLILAPFAGLLAARLWRSPGRARPLARGLVGLGFAYCLAYSLNVGLSMRSDTRYAAEAWLALRLPREARIDMLGTTRYLPRLEWLGYAEAQRVLWSEPEVAELGERAADYLVLSSKSFVNMTGPGAPVRDRLLAGEGGYRIEWDDQASQALWWLPGAWTESRVSPRILILAREDLPALAPLSEPAPELVPELAPGPAPGPAPELAPEPSESPTSAPTAP